MASGFRQKLISSSLQSFVADRKRVYRDIVSLGVVIRRIVLAGPGVEKIPADLLLSGVIELNDRAVSSVDLSVKHRLVPVVELCRIGQPIFQSDVGEAELAGKLAHSRKFPSFPVFDHFDIRAKACALGKPALDDSIDLDEESKILVRIHSLSGCH